MATCAECGGAIAGGQAACRKVFDDLAARVPGGGPAMDLHRLIVDCYCLQHPATFCRSAKSMASHLAGLCCGLEFSGHPNVYRALQRWLSGPRTLRRPDPPSESANVTVHDVWAAFVSEGFEESVELWAKTVWKAWSQHQPLAREWVKAALGNA